MWYLISTINRYIIRNFLFWFAVIFLATSLIIGLFEMVELTRRTMQHDINISLLLQLSCLRLPKILNDLLPSITFFAALGCFTRLSQSQNMVVMLSFGLSRMQFLGGVCVAVMGLGLTNIIVVDPIRSVMSKRMVFLEEKLFQKKPYSIAFTDTGLWLRETNKDTHIIIHANSLNILKKTLLDITIFKFNSDNTLEKRIDAAKALLSENAWLLEQVNISSAATQNYTEKHAEPTTITMEQIQHSTAPPETISFFQMLDFIAVLKKSGLNATSYLMMWHRQIAKIGMMVAFVFLAASFCFLSTRSKSFGKSVGLSVIFAFFMHFVEHLSYAYGVAEKLPLLAAAWLPPLITIASGYWIMVLIDDR